MGVYAIKHVYSITCDKCGSGDDTAGEACSVVRLVKKLRKEGWRGTYKKIKCPDCVEAEKKARDAHES